MVKQSLQRAEARLTNSRDGAGGLPVLWHLKVSPYNEKARWALDYKGIPHLRRAITPPQHVEIAQRLAGGRTFPVLELDGEALGDSTRIIAALEERQPDPALYPGDPAARRSALEIEEFFDEEFGPHLRLLVLHHALPDPDLLLGAFAPDLGRARRAAARATYPLVRRRIVAMFGIDEASVELAWQKCRAGCERFAAELQPSGHLVGDGFSVADLAVAAIFSPAVAPLEFPYAQPQRDHPRLAALRAMFEDSGAAEWTRRIYARYRPVSSEVALGAA